MAQKTKSVRKSRPLVQSYLERISSTIFSDFPKQLTDLVGKQHGVYALYKGDRLYYIGLATNLKNRINQHMKDRHAGKWNRFSLYLVRKADQIKEIESLILRIADPTGNAVKGGLPHADNLKSELRSNIRKAQNKQLGLLFGRRSMLINVSPKKKQPKTINITWPPALAPYVNKRFKIKATYKGKTYEARVRSNGKIYFKGIIYNSPSLAARGATGRAKNGWSFWCFKNKKGDWVKLDELRK